MAQRNGDLIGQVLGTCRLEQQIGRGGMSVVYLAQQMRPQRKVAVKILVPNVPMNSQVHDEFLARFLREADVVARLEHANIVHIYECNLQDGLAYLVMPYLPGGNLARLLAQRGVLSPQETLKYITEAAAALDYAHSQGIIHRDLKPGNFLLHADGRLVLADFGIAHMMQDRSSPKRATLTISGTVLGTPDYIAPEMTFGGQIDYRVDIYELGIVLYQMLSGDVPFKGRTSIETMLKHVEEPLPHLHHVNPSIPPMVDAVIQKAAAKKPEDRYTSAGAVAQALSIAITAPHYPAAHYAPTQLVLSAVSSPGTTIPVHPDNKARRSNANTSAAVQKPTRSAKSTRRPRRPYTLGLLLITVIVGLILTGVYIALPQSGSPPPKVPVLTPAQKAVQTYYNDINQRNYHAAYALASSDDSTSGYCHFVDSFAPTEHDDVTFDGTPQLVGGVFNVPITLHSTEEIPSGTWQTTYSGYQTVKYVNSVWMVIGGNLPQGPRATIPDPAPNTTTTQEGQAVMQRFYDDINSRDYPAAYKLWGTDFHNSTDYCGFVTGYAQTQHNDISFGNIAQQSDGTVLVPMTVQAAEQTSSGTQATVYQASYTVGPENGQWKILKGTMQKV